MPTNREQASVKDGKARTKLLIQDHATTSLDCISSEEDELWERLKDIHSPEPLAFVDCSMLHDIAVLAEGII